jgi:hypothetical protein
MNPGCSVLFGFRRIVGEAGDRTLLAARRIQRIRENGSRLMLKIAQANVAALLRRAVAAC